MLEFITSSPELKPNKIADDEDKNKSSIELRQPKPLLTANKKMKIHSSASIAANPMLCAVINPSILFARKTLLIFTKEYQILTGSAYLK